MENKGFDVALSAFIRVHLRLDCLFPQAASVVRHKDQRLWVAWWGGLFSPNTLRDFGRTTLASLAHFEILQAIA
jgi:hypothetical protein